MIELNEKTQQDFLNREWVQKLLDVGVNMSDAYYYLHNNSTGDCFILAKELADNMKEKGLNGSKILPTYTVSELLYKLHEKQGIYTIFNNLRNNNIDNIPIIESLAELLIKMTKNNKNA